MKKTRFLRYLSYWLYVLATIGIPIALIAWQFDLFKKPGPLQITGYGIVAAIIIIFVVRGHIKRAIMDMQKGVVRTILLNFMRLVPYIIFLFVLVFLEDHIKKVSFILLWSLIGNTGAMALDIWHTTLVQKCQNKTEE